MVGTGYLDKEHSCPMCHRRIDSIQTKEFENGIWLIWNLRCLKSALDPVELEEIGLGKVVK